MSHAWLLAGLALTAAALGYALGALLCVARHRAAPGPLAGAQPPVTILKPLCGDEIGLYDNLESFFRIDYPALQLVFGVRDAHDAALAVVERLRREFPSRDVAVVVNSQIHGTNLKVSNLVNMMPRAAHDILVIADSDIRVRPDYLGEVVGQLQDPAVGVVTCAYLARPLRGSLACRLAALQINGWFLPSVLVARVLGRNNFCMGSTMATRRDALEAVGGLAALNDLLADDYMLGQLMTERGYRVALASSLVETTVPEQELTPVLRHELRWARTTRTVEPTLYVTSVLMYTVPMALIAAGLLYFGAHLAPGLALLPVAGALGLRLALYGLVARKFATPPAGWWLVPIRDILSFGVWAMSFAGRSVVWRDQQLKVDAEGVLTEAVSEV